MFRRVGVRGLATIAVLMAGLSVSSGSTIVYAEEATDGLGDEAPVEGPEEIIPDPGVPDPTQWTVIARAEDACGRNNVYRYGRYNPTTEAGHNWKKIAEKHNIRNINVWKFVYKAPNCGYDDAGQRRRYYATAVKVECTNQVCDIVATRRIKLVMEFADSPVGGRFGAVTMWCLNYTRCPNWVDDAENANASSASASASLQTTMSSTGDEGLAFSGLTNQEEAFPQSDLIVDDEGTLTPEPGADDGSFTTSTLIHDGGTSSFSGLTYGDEESPTQP